MEMQLKPIFPTNVSKSRTTPTLTGIVVFCAMPFSMKKIVGKTKNKKEARSWVGCLLIFELVGSHGSHNIGEKLRDYLWDLEF